MNTPNQQSTVQPDGQRDALAESEKKADLHQPENYKEKETADKLVEIGPDVTQSPIKGIDPSEHAKTGR